MKRPLSFLHKLIASFKLKWEKTQNLSFCLKVSKRCNMIVKIDKVFVGLMGDFQEDIEDERTN